MSMSLCVYWYAYGSLCLSRDNQYHTHLSIHFFLQNMTSESAHCPSIALFFKANERAPPLAKKNPHLTEDDVSCSLGCGLLNVQPSAANLLFWLFTASGLSITSANDF